jgi:hypothetical protein
VPRCSPTPDRRRRSGSAGRPSTVRLSHAAARLGLPRRRTPAWAGVGGSSCPRPGSAAADQGPDLGVPPSGNAQVGRHQEGIHVVLVLEARRWGNARTRRNRTTVAPRHPVGEGWNAPNPGPRNRQGSCRAGVAPGCSFSRPRRIGPLQQRERSEYPLAMNCWSRLASPAGHQPRVRIRGRQGAGPNPGVNLAAITDV